MKKIWMSLLTLLTPLVCMAMELPLQETRPIHASGAMGQNVSQKRQKGRKVVPLSVNAIDSALPIGMTPLGVAAINFLKSWPRVQDYQANEKTSETIAADSVLSTETAPAKTEINPENLLPIETTPLGLAAIKFLKYYSKTQDYKAKETIPELIATDSVVPIETIFSSLVVDEVDCPAQENVIENVEIPICLKIKKKSPSLQRSHSLKELSTDRNANKEKPLLQRTYSSRDLEKTPQLIKKADKKKKGLIIAIPLKNYLKQKKDKKKEAMPSPSIQPTVLNPFKSFKDCIPERGVTRKSAVPLSPTIIVDTLNDLMKMGIIDGNWGDNTSTISATKNGDSKVHLTIHKHDKSDVLWHKRDVNVRDFINFVSNCHPELADLISTRISKKKAK